MAREATFTSGRPIAAAIAVHTAISGNDTIGDLNRKCAAARIAIAGSENRAVQNVPASMGNACGLPPVPVLLRSDATGNKAENQMAIGLIRQNVATIPSSTLAQ